MLLWHIVFISTTVTGTQNTDNTDSPHPIRVDWRVTGGQRGEDLAFMVLVVMRRLGVCTGSLISTQWVVTTAHCVEHSHANLITLKAGYIEPGDDDSPQKWEQSRWCSLKVEFPSHVRLLFDMALLRGHPAFRESALVTPLPLCRNWLFPRRGELCLAAGWQRRNASAATRGHAHYLMRYALVHVLNSDRCREYTSVRFHRTVLCARAEDGKSLCLGDSGAPLVCRGLLVGVAKGLADADPARDELVRPPQELQQVVCGGNRTFMAYTAVGMYRRWLGSYVVGMRLDWLGRAPRPRAPPHPLHLLAATATLACLTRGGVGPL